MSNYPDWKEGADVGDRVAFDLGFTYALLHRGAGLLAELESDFNLPPGMRERLDDMLEAISEFTGKRLQVRDQLYQGALELGKREERYNELYPDGPGASPEELRQERERGQLLEKMKAILEAGTYLIWSFEHERWWAPGKAGYVGQRAEAGLYSLAEAKAICLEANRYLAIGKAPLEAMVPLEPPPAK